MSGIPLSRAQEMGAQQQLSTIGRFGQAQVKVAPQSVAPPSYAPTKQVQSFAAPQVQQQVVSQSAPVQQAAAPAPAHSSNAVIIPTSSTFKFLLHPSSTTKAEKKMVASSSPLKEALKSRNLNAEQQLNVEGLYLRSFSNAAPHPLAVQIHGVNSKNLDLIPSTEDSDWATFIMHPSETANFMHMNDGKGLLLVENKLTNSALAKAGINIEQVEKQLGTREDYMEKGEPTHFFVKANLSSFLAHAQEGREGTHSVLNSSLNSAAKLLLSNAAPAFNLNDDIKRQLGTAPLAQDTLDELSARGIAVEPVQAAALPRLTPNRVKGMMFTDVHIGEDTHAREPATFMVRVPADEMRDMIDRYTHEVSQTSLPTKASAVTVAVHRPGSADLGDLKKDAFNIKKSELDSWQDTPSGAHVQLVYVVQHPGKAAAEANLGGL